MQERIIATCETKSDQFTKPGRLIMVEHEGAHGAGSIEFVVWWEETKADGTPVVPGRGNGYYTPDRGEAQLEFARRVEREASYWIGVDCSPGRATGNEIRRRAACADTAVETVERGITDEIEPNGMFEVWRPDQVAECIDGIRNGLYSKLWDLVPEYDAEVSGRELPVEPDVFCLAKFWSRFTPDEQRALNAAAEAEFGGAS